MHNNYAARRQLPTYAGSVLVLSSPNPAPDRMGTPKQDRQATILEVVSAHVVDSQEELRRLLRQRGWDVTQATLSRDLRELRMVRVPTADGPRYAPAGGSAQPVAAAIDAEEWPEGLGTIGGDDTILLVCRSSAARERIARRIRDVVGE